MTSRSEQLFYQKSARQFSPNSGVIVDLGCWMGSTTISLARGLMKNTEREQCSIHAFDQFIWEQWMDPYLHMVRKSYAPGDSFLDEVRWRLRKYSSVINIVQADLSVYRWENGEIDILLVDAMKNLELTGTIACSFFPHLDENSILIHQDFKHFYTPWIHILQYRLRDNFELFEDVPGGATVAFRCSRRPLEENVISAVNFEEISTEEVSAAFDYSMGLVNAGQQSSVAAAHIMFFVHGHDRERARRLLHDYSRRNMPATPDFDQAGLAVAGLDRENY